MHLRIYEVDVPIHDSTNPDRRGVHVFTDVADSPAAALRRAHEVYDAGSPRTRPDARSPANSRTAGKRAGFGPAGRWSGPPRGPASGTTPSAGSPAATSRCSSAPGQPLCLAA